MFFPDLASDVGDADLLQEFAVPGSGVTRHYGSHGEPMGPVMSQIGKRSYHRQGSI